MIEWRCTSVPGSECYIKSVRMHKGGMHILRGDGGAVFVPKYLAEAIGEPLVESACQYLDEAHANALIHILHAKPKKEEKGLVIGAVGHDSNGEKILLKILAQIDDAGAGSSKAGGRASA